MTIEPEFAPRAEHGFDAPDVIRTCFAASTGLALFGLAVSGFVTWPEVAKFGGGLVLAASLLPLALGLSLVAYGSAGRLRVRDAMLDMVPWTGAETVLDVGTGRGLLLIGAAKRLITGRVTGVDIWNAADTSGNLLCNDKRKIEIEGVADRAGVMTADARALPFADASFDVIFSLLCLHNIHDAAGRTAACREIARVLKPGGVALVGDYAGTGDYAIAFARAGLRVYPRLSLAREAFSMMSVVRARKYRAVANDLSGRRAIMMSAVSYQPAAAVRGTFDATIRA